MTKIVFIGDKLTSTFNQLLRTARLDPETVVIATSDPTSIIETVETWKPNVVVPLQNNVLSSLLGTSQTIATLRGSSVVASHVIPGVKLFPTYHSDEVRKQWKLYSVVVGDIVKATAESRYPEIRLPKRELILEPSLDDLEQYFVRIERSDLLSVDIETGWGQITSIGFAPDSEHAIVVPFLDKRRADRSYWDDEDAERRVWAFVARVLALPCPKLGQNFGGYDAYWLLQKYHIRIRNLLHDTRLQHHALYPELPKSLEFMGQSYGTQGTWKGWGKSAKHTKRDD